MPRSRSMSELGRPATSIQVWPGVPRWKRHSSTSTPCSTCTSSDVYSTRVKSSASSGTGARPASVPVAELAADFLEVRRSPMGLQRRLIVVAFQHDIDIDVGGLVQGIELVARLVG